LNITKKKNVDDTVPLSILGNKTKMKIIQVITNGHHLYGAQKHVIELSICLKKDGHDVLVVVGSLGRMTEILEQEGIAFFHLKSLVHQIHPYYDAKCVRDLIKIFKSENPDIVASHSSKAGIVARIACWLSKIPNTFTAHGWSFADGIPQPQKSIFYVIEKIMGLISYQVITVANIEKDYALSKKILPAHKIKTIYNGAKDNAKDLLHKKIKNEIFTITMVAGIRPQKDHETLIRALEKIRDLNWQVYFLGDGELENKTKALVDNLNLSQKFHFEGAVLNVEDYLLKTDIMALITNWEGLPISIIEGLSFGLPIVATNVAGVKEEVIDNYNGITVERGDIESIKTAILNLYYNADLRKQYGINSRKLFESNFTVETMYKNTLTLYQSII
jgi:glycosyltransferase involved in cell wall biosynthesis